MTGVYNATFFENNPEAKELPGILYCVALINKETFERECLKIGIAKGTSFKDVVKRGHGFNGYWLRIQKTYADTLYNVWKLEQALHEEFKEYSYKPQNYFGGHTECFEVRPEIIKAVPSRKK